MIEYSVEQIKAAIAKLEPDHILVVNSRAALDIGDLVRREKINVSVFGDPVVEPGKMYLVSKKALQDAFITDEKGYVHFRSAAGEDV